MASAGAHDVEVLPGLRRERAIHLAQQHVREAQNRVEWSAKFVAQCGQERAAISIVGEGATEILAVASFGLGESSNEVIERTREFSHLVHRTYRDLPAEWSGCRQAHVFDAPPHEVNVRVNV